MLTLGIFDALSKNVLQAFYGLMLILDGFIYGLISSLYEVFTIIASAKIFSNKIFVDITNRVYAVIGVVMLFFLAYSLLRAIINPDNFASDKKGIGKIVPNIVISIILIAIVPTLFTYAYKIQNVILENNLIGNIVLGKDNQDYEDQIIKNYTITYTDSNGTKQTTTEQTNITSTDVSKGYIKYGGTGMAQIIFESFFYRNEGYKNEDTEVSGSVLKTMGFGALTAGGLACSIGIGIAAATGHLTFGIGAIVGIGACLAGSFISGSAMSSQLDLLSQGSYTLLDVQRLAATTGDFSLYSIFAADDLISDGVIHYSWFLSTAAGIFVCYILLSFCLDLGVRAIKLGYYQIISPIPILANVLPAGKKIFDNWVKGTLSTFAGVFIRVFIIFLVVFIIQELPMITETNWWTSSGFSSTSGAVRLLARTAIILGLLMFAKQAPKLISDMFGLKDGDLKLGIKDKFMDAMPLRPIAAASTAVAAGANAWNGYKGKGAIERLARASAAGLGGLGRGFKASKDAKTFHDTGEAIKKATQESKNKLIDSAIKAEKYHGVAGRINGAIDDAKQFMGFETEDSKRFDLTSHTQLKKLQKQREYEKKIEDQNKAATDYVKEIIKNNSHTIELGLTSDSLQAYLNVSDSRLSEIFGTPPSGDWSKLTFEQLKKIQETKKDKNGRDLSIYELTAIDSMVRKENARLVSAFESRTAGLDSDGNWTSVAANVQRDTVYEGYVSQLGDAIEKAYSELGPTSGIFSNEALAKYLRPFTNKDIDYSRLGEVVRETYVDDAGETKERTRSVIYTTDNQRIVLDDTIGNILKKQAKEMKKQSVSTSSEISKIQRDIMEMESKDKK